MMGKRKYSDMWLDHFDLFQFLTFFVFFPILFSVVAFELTETLDFDFSYLPLEALVGLPRFRFDSSGFSSTFFLLFELLAVFNVFKLFKILFKLLLMELFRFLLLFDLKLWSVNATDFLLDDFLDLIDISLLFAEALRPLALF